MTLAMRGLYTSFLSTTAVLHSSVSLSFFFRSANSFGVSRELRPREFHSRSPTPLQMSTLTDSDKGGNDDKPVTTKPIVQYIVLRRDLDWPAGAMAAQAAHVSVAAIAQGLQANDSMAQAYISATNLPHMTKYVYGVDDLEALQEVQDRWKAQFDLTTAPENHYSHLWVEQPENIPTAFATWPVERTNKVSKVFKKLNLSFF